MTRAIILSAGRGSRLLPLTEFMPKCLVPVGGKAILDRQLAALAAAGVTEATVVAGYRFDQVAAHLERHVPPIAVDLRFNPFWAVSSSIGSVWTARDLLIGPFCLMNGDTTIAAAAMRRALAADVAKLGLLVEPIDAPAHDDMLVAVSGDAVLAVSKLLDPAAATHRSLGVVIAGGASGYRAALDIVIAGAAGIERYHHDVVAHLAAGGGVKAVIEASGAWLEIDRPEDIAAWDAGALGDP
jgi:L-glutamine-phosphate cytidylyltransferase